MAHIAGIEIPRNKRLFVGLTYIYGIGPTIAKEICQKQVSMKRKWWLTSRWKKKRPSVT